MQVNTEGTNNVIRNQPQNLTHLRVHFESIRERETLWGLEP